MAEELVLTDPIVVPEQVTTKYHVVTMVISTELTGGPTATPEPGLVSIQLRDDRGLIFSHAYHGAEAIDLVKWLNTANFSVNSMQKRVLQKLSNDGVLPGTVVGTPDPPVDDEP